MSNLGRITLIPSAAYVCAELAAEYGILPPAFLPVGHQRLYELQIAALHSATINSCVFLMLPQSFKVPSTDRNWFTSHQVQLIAVPDNLALSESILFALEIISSPYEEINILHGDTLIYDLPLEKSDIVAIGNAPEGYSWGLLSHKNSTAINPNPFKSPALAGYFAFSNAVILHKCLVQSEGNFIKGIELYDAEVVLSEFEVNDWLDFGHLQTFYRARCLIRTQRSFNDLKVNFREICKSSKLGDKILSEAHWFETIPAHLRTFTPALLGHGENPEPWYKLEYLPIPSLHELFVFGALDELSWHSILDSCFFFMHSCMEIKPQEPPISCNSALKRLILDKTSKRLDEFLKTSKLGPQTIWCYEGVKLPSLHEIALITSKAINFKKPEFQGVMHGDFCFTNIFYDFRTQKIRVIDPRGTIDNLTPSIYGDVRYDLAKLGHSIIGGYDFILADRFDCQGFKERDLSIQFYDDGKMRLLEEAASEFNIHNVKIFDQEIRALTIHLFLSMLPLHSDRPDRQMAFVANALRLFSGKF